MIFYLLLNGVAYGRGYDVLYPSKPDSKQTWIGDFETQKDYDKNRDLKNQNKKWQEQEILRYLEQETKGKKRTQKEKNQKNEN